MPSIFPYQSSKRVSSNRKLVRYSRLHQRWRKSDAISRQLPTPQDIKLISQNDNIEDDQRAEEGVEQVEESVEQLESVKQVEEHEQQHTSATVNTEITLTDTNCMQRECKFNKEKVIELTADIMVLQQKLSKMSSVLGRIGKDNKQVHFYTGLPSYAVFEALFHHLSPAVSKVTGSGSRLSLADEFLLVLMKLAKATTNQDLTYRFNIACCKVSNIFHQWVDVMAVNLKSFVCWPE